MRHQKKGHKLGRGSSHRKATLASLSTALITHKRITTTLPKAKALRVFVEPLISRAKVDSTHNRRMVFRRVRDKYAVTELFAEVAEKVGDRPGGYTRVIRLGQRAGDAAEMAVIELVDYNDIRPEGSSSGGKKRRTRRGRGKSGGGSAKASVAAAVADVVDDAKEAAAAVAEKASDVAERAADVVEDVVDDAKEAIEDVVDKVEDVIEDIVDGDDDAEEEEEDSDDDKKK
ncbi:MAG: 50S ribosomal protein L17 [Rhodothermales bacterium]|nr:50S ribosomal protein L17 [Rhodothermales bacterium]